MPENRKLGRKSDVRKAMLRGLVSALIENGKIETTEMRAKEVQKIAEKLVTLAVREADNFTSKQIKVTKARLDSGGRKITKSATSKNGRKYDVVDRVETTEMVTVDSPTRLAARKQIIKLVYRTADKEGKRKNLVDKLFNEIAPKYKNRNGGYTRIVKLAPRRGDAAEMAILEFV
ncbi:MAG: 50S ribosomal protein L17 [Eubacteriales bacterium]|nr:50S ribosomal protein L17 [Eubacteriales bacterium]